MQSALFLQQLFEYNHHCNQLLIKTLIAHTGHAPEKSLKLLSHILNAHHIWNCRIQQVESPRNSWQIHTLETLCGIDLKNYNDSLKITEQLPLDAVIEYTTFKGDVLRNTVVDILFHTINHATYHRGQIATDFRQAGLEPVSTDYIFHKLKP